MSATCPNGHASATDDFCDVCGAPIDASAAAAGSAPPPASASGLDLDPPAPSTADPSGPAAADPASSASGQGDPCPNCGAQNLADALFCENCGYDFATGQLPPPPPSIDPASGQLVPPGGAGTASSPSGAARSKAADIDWVAEVWVDPDWFNSQQAEGTCPTSGLPTVVPLASQTATIGRRSKSRGLDPEIDISTDGAISHRHAELALAGEQWSVKDLGSTNGTFVGRPDGTYPSTPLPPNQAHDLDDDERIYLGAWTRVVVRRATPEEKSGPVA